MDLESALVAYGRKTRAASPCQADRHRDAGDLTASAVTAVGPQRFTRRYRMPRAAKAQLLDELCCAASGEVPARTRRVMFVVAHSDDESIGAGATMCRLEQMLVVHVTDGRPVSLSRVREHDLTTREAYAEARRRELLEAMQIVGLPESRSVTLGYVDGETSERMVEITRDVMLQIDRYAPDVIITHPYEGGHTDHDSTAFAVHAACGLLRRDGWAPPPIIEMTSYYAAGGRRITNKFLPHPRADMELRSIILNHHTRQLKQRLFACFVTQQHVLARFSTAWESFRPAPRYIFTNPPHAGRLSYESFGDASLGQRWRSNASAALAELCLR